MVKDIKHGVEEERSEKSVLFISSDSKTLKTFRWALITEFKRQGYRVVCAASRDKDFHQVKVFLEQFNVDLIEVPFINVSLNLLKDIHAFKTLVRLVRNYKPSLVFSYRLKPVIYSGMLRFLFPRLRVFPTITGLGYGFTTASVFVRWGIRFFTRVALFKCEKVFFQNKDDKKFFLEKKIVRSHQSVCVAGSGVDLKVYPFSPLPESFSFLFIGRMIREKGVREYMRACLTLKKKYPNITFYLLGTPCENPGALSFEEVRKECVKEGITYLSPVEDVVPLLQKCSVFVLPSYREGVPRAGIEALSIGRPIITTDVPGCRELVIPGYNGILVAPQDVPSLAAAMEKLIQESHLLEAMGIKSRKLAQDKFDVEKVNRLILETVGRGEALPALSIS